MIPLFIGALARGDAPTIHGDGKGKDLQRLRGKRRSPLELLEALTEQIGSRIGAAVHLVPIR